MSRQIIDITGTPDDLYGGASLLNVLLRMNVMFAELYGLVSGASGNEALFMIPSPYPGEVANASFGVGGFYVNGTPTALQYSVDGSTWTDAGATMSGGLWSFTHPGLSAGSHTIQVRDTNNTSVTSSRCNVTVVASGNQPAQPAETLSISTITAPAASTSFAVSFAVTGTPSGSWQYSDNGGSNWATAAVTMSGSNGSFTHPGLAAGTYTIKLRDAVNTSVTATSNSFTIAASQGGSSYPNLSLTSPTYDTASPKAGTGALTSGSGTATITLPATRTVECWFKMTQGAATSGSFIGIVGQEAVVVAYNQIAPTFPSTAGTNQNENGTALTDGNWHHLALTFDGNYWTRAYLDGANGYMSQGGFSGAVAETGSLTFFVDVSQMPPGSEIDEIRVSSGIRYTGDFTPPTAPLTRDGTTLALWHLDGNGTGA